MSTQPQTVVIDPLDSGPRLGEVVGTAPRADSPFPFLTVQVGDATFRVGRDDLLDVD